MIIYEPGINEAEYQNVEIQNILDKFKEKSSMILANRFSAELEDVKDKVFTRYIYFRN